MGKTERIINIINALSVKPYCTARELAEELNVSERSVYRYLKDLRRFGYLFHTIKDPESAEKLHSLKPLTFTAAEALALTVACRAYPEGSPFHEHLSTAMDKITAAISPHEEKRHYYCMEKHFAHVYQNIRDYGPWLEHIDRIQECIRYNKTLLAVYDSHSSDTKERLMDPYNLYWSNGDMYLAAYCHNNKCMRSFKINRFIKTRKTDKTFTRDPNFNIREFIGLSWRVYRGEEEITLKLRVHPSATRFFRENRYHHSQQVQEESDGTLICTFTTYNTPETISWLLSWGSQVEVLEPAKVREKIIKTIKESLFQVYKESINEPTF